METCIYQSISKDLVILRSLTFRHTPDKNAVKTVLEDLESKLEYVDKFGDSVDKSVLGYVIRNAIELSQDILTIPETPVESIRRLNDYCDAVHNICELFTKDTWTPNSFYHYFLSSFRRKYGEMYFSELMDYFERQDKQNP